MSFVIDSSAGNAYAVSAGGSVSAGFAVSAGFTGCTGLTVCAGFTVYAVGSYYYAEVNAVVIEMPVDYNPVYIG